MYALKPRLVFFMILIVAGVHLAQAQICTIQASDTMVCEGTTVLLSVTVNSGSPISYSWNFGDGFTSGTSTPGHTYTTPGVYVPSVTVSFAGGANCSVTGSRISVFGKPVSKFTITSKDSLCFKGNQLCILDQSYPGVSGAPIRKRVFQLSNGYFLIDSLMASPTICYNNSIDVNGHLYSLVLEVSDTNNCVSRLVKTDSVRLFPRIDLLFLTDFPETCGDIPAKLINKSIDSLPLFKRFYWNFGDGQINSTQWDSVTLVYRYPGPYVPKLVVTDWNNCIDSFTGSPPVAGIIRDSLIYNSTPMKQCFKGHYFMFTTINPKGKAFWGMYDEANTLLFSVDDRYFTDTIRFPTCGRYRIHLKVVFPDCILETDTIVTVLGPKSIFQDTKSPSTTLKNIIQCEVFDSVNFIGPFPYMSCMNGNGTKFHLWDFGDPYAPACTTDTRHGINIGLNCRYSRDSSEVNHKYKEGKDSCYRASLYIRDSLTGCEHSDTLQLSLGKPNAHPDPFSNPPRRGLYVDTAAGQCLFNRIRFWFDGVLPSCTYEKAWMNFDSTCDKNAWRLVDTNNQRYYDFEGYGATCDSNGYVTVGLIIKNGKDRNGKECYDTAWYHHLLRLIPMDVNFKITVVNPCKPYEVELIPDDSVQYNLRKTRWSRFYYSGYPEYDSTKFMDPLLTAYYYGDTAAQYFGPTDSVINRIRFSLKTAGVYAFSFSMENNYKCTRGNGESIALGFYKNFTASTFLTCIHKPVVLLDTIRYYSLNSFNLLNPVPYWNMPARAAANKEKIYWDIGDGKGFAYEGSHPIIRYTKPGTYTIKMIVQDSLGCRDTLVRHNLIRVVDLQPRIGLLQTSYLCAPQIVQFKDLSLVADSIGDTIPSKNDSIVSRQWEFGDETPLSALKDPAHNFTSNRIFTTTLTITTSSGCIDTARQQVELKGPVPLFVIKDTMGCEPFTAQFVNTTGKPLNSWTWYYGDPLNQTFTTTRDTDVLFTYTKAGVYSIKLLGTESVFNPNTGNTIICNSFFPDPSNEIPERKVYVLPTPLMDVRFNDSICTNTPLRLTAFGDPLYNRMTWVYGDRDSVTTQRPDTIQYHSFAAPGLYSFKLIPINSSGTSCNDTVNKTIWVTDVQADFMVDSAQAPLFKFQNTSLMAQRFVWDFGKPSAGSENVSYTTNGLFHYGTDTGSYIVCLRAFNREDCEDSICKRIRIVNARVIIPNVFTPDNNDDRNDAFDIDIDGFTVYKLQIFNRWGTEVFFSERDGYRNDGINWNGKDHNTGEHCSAGTYYFIFTYQLITEPQLKTVHGTVTLIR